MKTSSKILLGFFVYSLTLLIAGTALAFWWAAAEFTKAGPLQESLLFEVKKGSSLYVVAHSLKEEGAVESPYIFMFGTRIIGAQSDLKAGEYELTAGLSPREILEKIRAGDVVNRRITVREGLTSYQVVEIVRGVKELDGEITDIPAEGTLLPQTYDYRLHETRQDVINRMKVDMAKTMAELWPNRSANLPFMTEEEALTLASIVEKETGVEAERKKVAGVFINRLRRSIALQSDPTVIYGITKGQPKNEGLGPLGRRLLKKDLEEDTPYNTYRRPGLPPTPIANPGRASIEAVLHPEEHDFVYFVADGTGGHVFAATLTEHNRNVAEWQKIRRAKQKN
jgi:UPF0755 protein